MTTKCHSEIEIINQVVSKKSLQAAQELFASRNNKQAKELSQKLLERKNFAKLAGKIWKTLCKQVKQQLENGSIVDTLYFGTFTLASTIQGEGKNFVYCPGPKAALKLIENEDNLSDLPQALLDEKLVTASFA